MGQKQRISVVSVVLKLILLGQLLVLSCGRSEDAAAVQAPVVLISIDTLRSDRLPAYGYPAIATPHLDRLASDGVVYEHAYAHVPLTLPSHATIFTGLLPTETRIRDNAGAVLDAKLPTLAGELRARGYATAGFVSAYVMRASTGIGSGFETYDDELRFVEGAPTGNLQRPGSETIALAKQWITANASRPFFAFVHLFEPHAPYEPTYDAEIVKSDALVGDLLDSLRAQKLYDDALIVVLSDHGEGLMDHGEQEHGVLLYREALQVPLIVKWPKNDQRGTRVAAPIGLSSVKSLVLHEPVASRPIYAETLYPRIHLGWSDLRSVIRYPLHLIDGPKPELYDLAADPRETSELRYARRREYAELKAVLPPPIEPGVMSIPPEEAKKLAALGYVTAGMPVARSSLNPRDHLGDLAALKRVTELMQSRDFATAAKEIETLLKRNPGWSDLRDQLGVAYEELGDFPSAERAYRDAIRTTPELAGNFAYSLAQVLLVQGKLDDAEAHARLALAVEPAAARVLLGEVAFARRDFDKAANEALAANFNENLDAQFLVARIQAARGAFPEAVVTLQRIDKAARERRVPRPPGFDQVAEDVLRRVSGNTPRSASPRSP
jgi:choline-sulfatase